MKLAALVKKSMHVEGDERSRTNPGHGYPAHTVDYVELVEFKDEAEMQRWVENQERWRNTNYRLIKYEELKVTTTVRVIPASD